MGSMMCDGLRPIVASMSNEDLRGLVAMCYAVLDERGEVKKGGGYASKAGKGWAKIVTSWNRDAVNGYGVHGEYLAAKDAMGLAVEGKVVLARGTDRVYKLILGGVGGCVTEVVGYGDVKGECVAMGSNLSKLRGFAEDAGVRIV